MFSSELSLNINQTGSAGTESGYGSIHQGLVGFLESNPQISRLANYEKLCKLKNQLYVICPDYCCGEFWESQPQFCCKNNFKPIRNLFFFLLISFAVLFATIIMYLFVEIVSSVFITRKMKEFEAMDSTTLPNSFQAVIRDLLSTGETSLDEESSLDNESAYRATTKPKRHLLFKHSQSFKEMSKKSIYRRNARIRKAKTRDQSPDK